MKSLTNIEKSGFHRGQYVRYGGGFVWRIVKSTSSYGNWFAYKANIVSEETIYAHTLESMSEKLKGISQ